jgi:hypothetical protein
MVAALRVVMVGSAFMGAAHSMSGVLRDASSTLWVPVTRLPLCDLGVLT